MTKAKAAAGSAPHAAARTAHRVTPVDAPHPPRPLLVDIGRTAAAYAVSFLALSLIFQPLTWWPLALVGLVPWTVATCRTDRAWVAHWLSFLGGWAYFLGNLHWLMPVTGLGYVALAFYLAVYWVLAAWAVRTARRRGISPLWSLPVVWVACEYLRAFVMTGFPWLFLAHAFADVLVLIQISDIGGAYAVTFLVVMVNGVLAELWLQRRPRGLDRPRWRQLRIGAAVCGVLVVASLVYGLYRLRQVEQFRTGPRVAVVQEDFPLRSTGHNESPEIIFARYLQLAARAAAEQPDLLVFPETVWASAQNIDFVSGEEPRVEDRRLIGLWRFSVVCHELTAAFARGDYARINSVIGHIGRLPYRDGPAVPLLVGSMSMELFPEQIPFSKRYNSVLMYDADGTQRAQRYDKIHLVPFGEVVPFRYGRLHPVYRWLNSLSPFSEGGTREYSLTAGREKVVFTLEAAGSAWRFGTPICYEDVMPYIPRKYTWRGGERRVDFLVNMSNDGWFLHSAELPQHLAICVFRAVENRVGIVRAVNTGISGFIDPNGRTYGLVRNAAGRAFGKGIIGYSIEPVLIDTRASFYGRWGDWLPRLCLVLATILWVEGVVARWIWAARIHIQAWWRRRRARGGLTDA